MVCGNNELGDSGVKGKFRYGRRTSVVDGIKVIEFKLDYSNSDNFIKRAIIFLKFAFRSVLIALTEKYDVVFATSTPLTASIPGIFARWIRGKKFIFEVRDLWPELPKEMGVIKNPILISLMSHLEWIAYHSAHKCIGLSPGITEGIKKRGVCDNNVIMIPNGCDLSLFDMKADPWTSTFISKKDFLAIFAGAHGLANGLDALIDVAYELQKRNRFDIKFILVGKGKLKSELKNRAKDLGLRNILFHDPVSKYELAGLFQRANVGLQILKNIPAFYNGTSPNKFFDYISAGLPVMINYPGWLATLIEENNCGISIKPDDPIAFANTLESITGNEQKLSIMGQNARSLAENHFNRETLSEDWAAWVIDKHN